MRARPSVGLNWRGWSDRAEQSGVRLRRGALVRLSMFSGGAESCGSLSGCEINAPSLAKIIIFAQPPPPPD